MQQNFEVEEYIQCPQCGYTLPLYIKYTKLVQCESCKSTIFLEDEAVKVWGDSSVLAKEVSILELNQAFSYKNKRYLPIGKIRYSYGRGFWEEWWLIDDQGDAFWLSVDEGDLVLEKQIETPYDSHTFDELSVGSLIDDGWVVTEIGGAKCEGFEGAIPKEIKVGSLYRYIHLQGKDALFRTVEISSDKVEVYEGRWISPFDIQKVM